MKVIPPDQLIQAYSTGIFPMSDARSDKSIEWFSAKKRGIIPLDKFSVSKNVRRIIRQNKFEWSINRAFPQVILACAERESTWISDLIINSFSYMHKLGYAHSVEIWNDGNLVGGLYGMALGGAFFGESMFKRESEADKLALYYCYKRMIDRGFVLWDTQFYTDHLAQFGCIEITDRQYDERLNDALERSVYFDQTPPDTVIIPEGI